MFIPFIACFQPLNSANDSMLNSNELDSNEYRFCDTLNLKTHIATRLQMHKHTDINQNQTVCDVVNTIKPF